MNKNILIAVLIGIIVGQFSSSYAHADSSLGISKHDLIEACALGGIFANSGYGAPLAPADSKNEKIKQHYTKRICETVKEFADALDEKQ